MKVGNKREPGMNGGLWMMKDGGRDLEGRSWRKGVGESSRGESEEARRKKLDGWSNPEGGNCTEV